MAAGKAHDLEAARQHVGYHEGWPPSHGPLKRRVWEQRRTAPARRKDGCGYTLKQRGTESDNSAAGRQRGGGMGVVSSVGGESEALRP